MISVAILNMVVVGGYVEGLVEFALLGSWLLGSGSLLGLDVSS